MFVITIEKSHALKIIPNLTSGALFREYCRERSDNTCQSMCQMLLKMCDCSCSFLTHFKCCFLSCCGGGGDFGGADGLCGVDGVCRVGGADGGDAVPMVRGLGDSDGFPMVDGVDGVGRGHLLHHISCCGCRFLCSRSLALGSARGSARLPGTICGYGRGLILAGSSRPNCCTFKQT